MWRPWPKQQQALERWEFEILFGGARGPGKTDAGISWLTYDVDNPKLRALVIRKNSTDLVDWIDRANLMYSQLGAVKFGNPPVFRWPSGCIFRTGHLKDKDAYTKYIGHEYHRMVIEELNQIAFEDDYMKLLSSARSTVEGLTPQVFCTTNPGGPGHGWIKNRWQIPDRPEKMVRVCDKDSQRYRIFIPARMDDNPTLMEADPNYIKYIESFKHKNPNLYKAWRFGRWDVFAGMAFAQLSRDVHIIKPFKLPENTAWFGAYDWGYKHPFAFVLFAVTPDERVYITNYVKAAGKSQIEQAELISKVIGKKQINIHSGLDLWSKRGGPTLFEQIRNELPGCTFVKAKVDRLQGANEVRKYISWEDTESREPKLKFFDTATEVFDCLSNMQYDSDKKGKNAEDVMKIDADSSGEGGDDLYDAVRYGLMSRAFPNPKQVETLDRDSGQHIINLIKEGEMKRRALRGFL